MLKIQRVAIDPILLAQNADQRQTLGNTVLKLPAGELPEPMSDYLVFNASAL
jgi:hypothetical protein